MSLPGQRFDGDRPVDRDVLEGDAVAGVACVDFGPGVAVVTLLGAGLLVASRHGNCRRILETGRTARSRHAVEDVAVRAKGDRERSTLVSHIDRKQAADLADRVEALRRDQGARTQRERHADTDIRVLTILD